MLLVLPLLAGLITGLVFGGKFRNLATIPIRFGWLFLLGLALQLVLFTSLTDTQQWDIRYGHVLYVGSLLLVLSALVLNARRLRWPILVMAAGASLNLLVIVANGGAMPVDIHLLGQSYGQQVVANLAHHRFATNVTPLTAGTRLGFLGDRISIAAGVYSVGDIILGLGGFLLMTFEMTRKNSSVKTGSARFRNNSSLTQAA